MTTPDLESRLQKIRFLLTDVDGVLTDGRLYFDYEGNEIKVFCVHDGAAFAYWHRSGFASGVLSGRNSVPVRRRAESLGIEEIHLGQLDKEPPYLEMLERRGLSPDEVLYIGDDLLDLPVLRRVGVAITVPEAREEVRSAVHYVTESAGGAGVAREVVEMLLKAKGLWAKILAADGRP